MGHPYTWERGRGTNKWVEIKLDRALVTRSFNNIFTVVKLTNLEIITSDHSPIFLEPAIVSQVIGMKTFRFENAWLREPMCLQIVEEVWHRHSGRSLQDKLDERANILTVWGAEIKGRFKDRIAQCKNVMRRAKSRRDEASVRKYQEATNKLNQIYNQWEFFWRKRSKQLWLKEGDQNSKYFHATAKNRRRADQINCLTNEAGQKVGWDSGLQSTMMDYFMNLFNESGT